MKTMTDTMTLESNPVQQVVQEEFDLLNYRVVVVIPSYNEERFIGSVVLKIRRFPVNILVVDDGSSDSTADIAVLAGAMVLRQPTNQGKGAALNVGIQRARELNPDAIVVIDADGQHLPEELPLVVRPVLKGEADIVVGSRYLEKENDVPTHRVMGHRVINWITSTASRVSVSDSQSGYRAFSPRAFQDLNFSSKGFSVESEIQFLAHEKNLTVKEVPITVRYTDPPKRSVISQGLTVLDGIIKLTSQYRPLLYFGLPGLFLILVGMGWGFVVIEIYRRIHQLAVGYAMISVLLSIVGLTLLSNGVILHSLRALIEDISNK